MPPRFGLQLYTLREECARDLEAALAFVADCGYAGVEVAMLHERSARDFRARLDAHGLAVASCHALPFGDAAAGAFDDAQALGAPLVVVPFAPPDRFASASTVAALAAELNAACAQARERGLRLGYHNHFWEWRPLDDGRAAFDALVAQLDPALEIELDIYWATTAKRDPVAVIRALGDGAVDLRGALRAAEHADWMLVELDRCVGEMRDAVRRSAAWLGLAGR